MVLAAILRERERERERERGERIISIYIFQNARKRAVRKWNIYNLPESFVTAKTRDVFLIARERERERERNEFEKTRHLQMAPHLRFSSSSFTFQSYFAA
jgi:hypothetical protein